MLKQWLWKRLCGLWTVYVAVSVLCVVVRYMGMILMTLVAVPLGAKEWNAHVSEFDALGCIDGVGGLVPFNLS